MAVDGTQRHVRPPGGVLDRGSRDDVAIEIVLRATNTGPLEVGSDDPLPPTGRRIELPSVWFLRLRGDGRIVEERDYLDTASFFRQLGLAGDE